jgi:hypothetical protein
MSSVLEGEFDGLRLFECDLPMEAQFWEFVEPDAIYILRRRSWVPRDTVLFENSEVLRGFGLNLDNAKLALSSPGAFALDDFYDAVGEAAPTLLLVELDRGVVGGFLNAPWQREPVIDASWKSFIFELGLTPEFAVPGEFGAAPRVARLREGTHRLAANDSCRTVPDSIDFTWDLRIRCDGRCRSGDDDETADMLFREEDQGSSYAGLATLWFEGWAPIRRFEAWLL